MNLLNIAKHLLYLAQIEYGSDNSTTTADETFAAERLFQVLKSFKDSYFSEVYTYDTLEFDDEYDEMADREDSDNECSLECPSENVLDKMSPDFRLRKKCPSDFVFEKMSFR